jgi:PAS domain S-box-containing protein
MHRFTVAMMASSEASVSRRSQTKRLSHFSAEQLAYLSSDAIHVRDSQERIIYWNSGAQRLYGWSSREALGRPLADLLGAGSETAAQIGKALDESGVWEGELSLRRRNGAQLTLASRSWLMQDASGESNEVLQIDTDVTARKQAENESATFRSLFEATAGAYLVVTPEDYRIVAVSDAYLHATSTDRSIIGRKLFDIFPDLPPDPAADGVRNLRTSLQRVKKNRCVDVMNVQRYPIHLATEGGRGEERYWSPVNSPVFAQDGQLIFIVHRVEDVTPFVPAKKEEAKGDEATAILQNRAAQMQAEIVRRTQELSRANEQLRETEARFRQLADTIPQLGWMARPDGWIFWLKWKSRGKTRSAYAGTMVNFGGILPGPCHSGIPTIKSRFGLARTPTSPTW